MSYCDAADLPYHGPYHNTEYGFPISDDNALFERLMLEINQAGLSWLTILKKKDNFHNAYHAFDIERVARVMNEIVQTLRNLGDGDEPDVTIQPECLSGR